MARTGLTVKRHLVWLAAAVTACVIVACAVSLRISPESSPMLDIEMDVTDAKSPAIGIGGGASSEFSEEEEADDDGS